MGARIAQTEQGRTGGITTAQKRMGGTGKRLGTTDKVVRPSNVITDGPLVEVKESLAGYMFVKANSLEEAVELTKGHADLTMGGSIEARAVIMDAEGR